MKKFIANLKRYKSSLIYSAKATLKGEVAGSRLNWLWWILDPFLFMLVYTFMALVVFGKGEPYFPLYVFIGLNMYDFFNRTVRKSVRMVKRNKSMISKVYIPKYVLIINEMIVNAFKMCVAFMLVVVMIPVYRVPLTWHVLEAIPVFLVLLLLTFRMETRCITLLIRFLTLKEHGATILFSTHITSDLERCADNIIYISCGAIRSACSRTEFQRSFGKPDESLEEIFLRMEREVRS